MDFERMAFKQLIHLDREELFSLVDLPNGTDSWTVSFSFGTEERKTTLGLSCRRN